MIKIQFPKIVGQIKHRHYVMCSIFLFNAGNQLPINNIVNLCFAISTRGQYRLYIFASAS